MANECFEYDTTYWHHDLLSIPNVQNATACKDECQSNPNCKVFTYVTNEADWLLHTNKKRCYLKKESAVRTDPESRNGVVSGKMSCFNSKYTLV